MQINRSQVHWIHRMTASSCESTSSSNCSQAAMQPAHQVYNPIGRSILRTPSFSLPHYSLINAPTNFHFQLLVLAQQEPNSQPRLFAQSCDHLLRHGAVLNFMLQTRFEKRKEDARHPLDCRLGQSYHLPNHCSHYWKNLCEQTTGTVTRQTGVYYYYCLFSPQPYRSGVRVITVDGFHSNWWVFSV